MYIIRSNAKVHEFSESAKNERVRTEKKGGAFPCPMHEEKYIIFGS
jgi:hypothetical protein